MASVYGPLFTLATYPLAQLGVPAAFWVAQGRRRARRSAVVALVWRSAERLGRDPRLRGAGVGLNPLVLVHVVGGAHNDALTSLLLDGRR